MRAKQKDLIRNNFHCRIKLKNCNNYFILPADNTSTIVNSVTDDRIQNRKPFLLR